MQQLRYKYLAMLCASLTLAACGGSDDTETAPGAAVNPQSSASSRADHGAVGGSLSSPSEGDAVDEDEVEVAERYYGGSYDRGGSTSAAAAAAPSIPTGLASGTITSSEIQVSWTAVSGSASYRVYRNGKRIASVTSTTHTDTALTADTEYRYRVKACNAESRCSQWSLPLTVRTLSATTPPPDDPGNGGGDPGNGGGDPGNGGGTPGTGGNNGPMAKIMTKSYCTDGKYTETLPDTKVSISDITAGLVPSTNASALASAMLTVLDRRYPAGAYIVRTSPNFDKLGNCGAAWAESAIGYWGNSGITASELKNSLSLTVHECGHALDSYYSAGSSYVLTQDRVIPTPYGNYYPRSELINDEFAAEIPDADANSTYITGTAKDGDLNTTLDELAQYNHSVAVTYAMYEEAKNDFDVKYSLNFAWILQRYLHGAKQNHNSQYEAMLANANWREAILALWGQTWFYYDALKENTSWEPTARTNQYVAAMQNPKLMAIMDEVRQRHGCTAP